MGSEATRAKAGRALARLQRGDLIYQLASGQWRFAGNKFVPGRIAQQLPIEQAHAGNDGATAYKLREDARDGR